MIFPKLDSDATPALQSLILVFHNEGADMLYRPESPCYEKRMNLISSGVYHRSRQGQSFLTWSKRHGSKGKIKPRQLARINQNDNGYISLTCLALDVLYYSL